MKNIAILCILFIASENIVIGMDDDKSELEELREKNAALISQLKQLLRERSILVEELTQIKHTNYALTRENDDLKKQNEQLQQTILELKKDSSKPQKNVPNNQATFFSWAKLKQGISDYKKWILGGLAAGGAGLSYYLSRRPSTQKKETDL